MDAEDCDTVCAPLENTTQGNIVVTAVSNAEGDTAFAGCKYNLTASEDVQFPAIIVSDVGETNVVDGSAAFPIEIPLQVNDNILHPLIVRGSLGHVTKYQPKQILGKFRVGGLNTIGPIPYVFPGLIANDLEETANPDFYLGANKVTLMCGDGPTPIQLLKILNTGDPPVLPIAIDDTIEAEFETAFNFDPKSNDTGVGIEVTLVSNPPHGTATIELDGTVTYLPDNDYFGPDSFTYTITDDAMNTDIGTVNVTVFPVINAVNDDMESEFETPLNFDPRDNDVGESIDIVSVTQPDNGTVVIEIDGTLTYTPDDGFEGTDTFTYTIEDSFGQTDTATVDVDVATSAGDSLAEPCADTCSMLDENRIATAIPSVELWLDCFCQTVDGGTIINTFEDGGTRNNDVTSAGSNRPAFSSVGGNNVLFDETDDQFLTKAAFAMFNSGASTGGTMIAVASVDVGFAGTRIPIACWGPVGAPLMSIEFNFSGSWSVTGKINGHTRSGSFDPVGKMFVVAVGNQVDFGGGTASWIRIYEITGGALSGGVLTHSPGSAVFTAGQSGDLYIGGHDATDTGSFRLHEFVILSKPIIFGGAFDPDATCLATKWG